MFYIRWIMRLALWSIVFAMLFNGCTTINLINERLNELMYVDSQFKPYVRSFVQEANKRRVHVDVSQTTIIFGKTKENNDDNAVGTCSYMTSKPLITIDEEHWYAVDPSTREELIYHELGHCVLGRDHCEAVDKAEPYSIMEPKLIGSYYGNNREAMIDELFKPDKRCP